MKEHGRVLWGLQLHKICSCLSKVSCGTIRVSLKATLQKYTTEAGKGETADLFKEEEMW